MAINDIAYEGDLDDIVIGEEADRKPYTILPPGTYPFSIDEPIQRERYMGSDKIPPCWKVTVKLNVDGGDVGSATVFYNLFVTEGRSWAIKQLFVGVGLIDPNVEKFSPPWSQLPGTVGVVEINNQEYNGKTYNNVKKILDPIEGAEAVGRAMVAETTPAPVAPAATQTTFNYPR